MQEPGLKPFGEYLITMFSVGLRVADRKILTRIFLIFSENVHKCCLFPGQLPLSGLSQSRRRYATHWLYMEKLYRVYKKNVPITKSLLGWIFAKLQIPTATKS